MNKHVAKKPIALKIGVVTGALAILLSALTPLSATAAVPALTSVSPSSGTAAGGTSIVITGTGFTGVTCSGVTSGAGVTLGGVPVASCTVNSNTQITAVLPTRAGNAKTIGPQDIAVTNGSDTSVAGSVRYTYTPVVDSSKTNNNLVILGDLASRSQRKPVTRTTTTPYVVNGTDSLSGAPYSYTTNYQYSSSNAAYQREGDQPGYHTGAGTPSLSTKSVTATTFDNRNVQYLRSNGSCGRPAGTVNTFDSGSGSMTTFCTVFGPEIYSEAFYATDLQALSFEWQAVGNTDDYSVYGFLVAVADDTTIPTPTTSNNKIVMHGSGSRSGVNSWITSTANVDTTGLYRFRFVNGSFDGTGGHAIGSDFYINSVFVAGDKNQITLNNPGDQVSATSPGPYVTTATATSGQAVTVTSLTTGVCTVATTGTNPTSVTVTRVSDGTCTLQGAQAATGNFTTAATVTTSFDILATAVVPAAPTITAVTNLDSQVTVTVTRPNRDGGSPITKYQYTIDNGVTWVDLPLVNNDVPSPFTIPGLTNGTTYQIKVRAVNAIGNGPASGAAPGTPAGSVGGGNSGGGSSSGGSTWTPPVTPAPVTPPPAKRPPVTITIGGFKPGSPVLTKQIQAAIKSFIAKNPDYKNVIATGVTDGPTVLKVDKTLSKTRATNALSFLTKTLKAPVAIADVKAKQETRKGSAVRRIVLTLTD